MSGGKPVTQRYALKVQPVWQQRLVCTARAFRSQNSCLHALAAWWRRIAPAILTHNRHHDLALERGLKIDCVFPIHCSFIEGGAGPAISIQLACVVDPKKNLGWQLSLDLLLISFSSSSEEQGGKV